MRFYELFLSFSDFPVARSLPDSTQDIRHLSSSQGVAALLQALMIYSMVTYVWFVLVCFELGGFFWPLLSKTWDWPFRCRHFTVLSLVALDVIILDMVFAADAGRDADTTFVEFWSRTNDSTGLELKPRSVVHGMQHVEVTVILLRHAATWTQLKNRHNFLP